MGASTDHALGRNLRFFAKVESAAGGAYGTASQETLDAADAAKVLSTSMEFTVTRNNRADSRTTRSVLERITGKQEVSWSCESYLLPIGTNFPPDISPLLNAGFGLGAHTDSAGTEAQATITGVSKNNPAIVTCSGGHSFKTGDKIYIGSVTGMTQIQNTVFEVTSTGTTTFQLTGIDSTGYGTFSSTATATLLTYRGSDTNALPTLRMMRTADDVLREDLFGAWVEEVSISASGGDEPRISFSGGAFNYALTGSSAANGSGSSASTLNVTAGDGVNFMVGSELTVNSTARIVTAKSTDAITLSAAASWSGSDAVTPTTYTETTAGNPVNGIGGGLTLNSVTLPITGFDVTLTNGVKALSDEALTKGTSDFVSGYRTVTGTITVRARKDMIKSFAQRYVQTTSTANPTFTSIPVVVTLGSRTGYNCVVRMDTVELDFGAIDIPEAEEAILNIPFTALGSDGGDEIYFDWNQD
jgi:hypothetical protein